MADHFNNVSFWRVGGAKITWSVHNSWGNCGCVVRMMDDVKLDCSCSCPLWLGDFPMKMWQKVLLFKILVPKRMSQYLKFKQVFLWVDIKTNINKSSCEAIAILEVKRRAKHSPHSCRPVYSHSITHKLLKSSKASCQYH